MAVFCSQPARVGNEDSGIGGDLKCMLLRIRADLTDSPNSENKGNFGVMDKTGAKKRRSPYAVRLSGVESL